MDTKTIHLIGFIAGIFGLYGVAHLLNRKILSGILWLLIGGPMFLTIMWTIAAVTVIGIPIGLALHFIVPWHVSKNGAAPA
ncbi:MAG: hypothetical protein NZ750_09010 [Anaerolineae bacterium]|nr:hypothetical protein [Anaerolineae bacterium]MDW8171757.1 hypothetical protein [Anaerolineae bacterium]